MGSLIQVPATGFDSHPVRLSDLRVANAAAVHEKAEVDVVK